MLRPGTKIFLSVHIARERAHTHITSHTTHTQHTHNTHARTHTHTQHERRHVRCIVSLRDVFKNTLSMNVESYNAIAREDVVARSWLRFVVGI